IHVDLGNPSKILRVTGQNPPSQFLKGLMDQRDVVVVAHRRVDDVADVNVDAEGGPVDGSDQLQIRVWSVRDVPRLHLDRAFGDLWLYGVQNLPAVFHGTVEEFLGNVLGMRPG